MAKQYVSSNGVVINETGTFQYFGNGGFTYIDETESTSTTINCSVGNIIAAGVNAVVFLNTNINCSVGDTTANGATATINSAGNINCSVGDSFANGSNALINVTTIIGCTVGDTAATGNTASISFGSATTISCTVGDGLANGVISSVKSYIVTDRIINNTGTILSNQAVYYTWWPAGRIGSMTGITPTEGSGTTDGNGKFTTNIEVTPGVLMLSVRSTGATTDSVYYEAR